MKYYDIKYTLSRGSPINMIIGQRGCGKTYSSTKYVLDNWRDKRERFLYIRRNRNQIAPAAANFFSKYNNEYPVIAMKKCFVHDEEIIGYYCNLSEANTLKSGFDLETVTTILFDEVIEENPEKYLIGEYMVFANLLDTCVRLRDNVKVIFLGNSFSLYNPYTLQWNVNLSHGQRRWCSPDNFFRLELVDMPDITKARRESLVGKFTAGTLYDEMATGNNFIQDTDDMILKRDKSYKVAWLVNCNNLNFYLWVSPESRNLIIDTAGYATKYCFTVTKSNVNATYKYLPNFPDWFMRIRKFYNNGQIYYQSKKIRTQFMQVLKYI